MVAGDLLEELALDRAGDADEVHAVMLIEALVLDGDERLADVLRQRADRDAGARLAADVAKHRAVACEDEGRLWLRDDLPDRTGAARLRERRVGEQQRDRGEGGKSRTGHAHERECT